MRKAARACWATKTHRCRSELLGLGAYGVPHAGHALIRGLHHNVHLVLDARRLRTEAPNGREGASSWAAGGQAAGSGARAGIGGDSQSCPRRQRHAPPAAAAEGQRPSQARQPTCSWGSKRCCT